MTPAQVERLAGQFEAVWRRPPTAAERAGLVDDYVREEVYYREALALGLDRDDTVIRRRLRQKMEFLGDAGAGGAGAGARRSCRRISRRIRSGSRAPARVTFRQVFLGDADPGGGAGGAGGGRRSRGGRARHRCCRRRWRRRCETSVDGTFGDGFFAAVAALPPGAWQGPVASAFGDHLVRLVEAEPAAAPPFEEVRAAVEEDWRREKAAELREAQYQALRGALRGGPAGGAAP